jgi:tetratricopeptide (TPR) repeat protein
MPISARRFSFVGIFVFFLAFALPVMAQNRIVQGKITDDKGSPVVGASISIEALDSSRPPYKTKSDKKGQYLYMGLAAGSYRVVVRMQGFQPAYKYPVTPQVTEPANLDLQLTPGQDIKLPFEMTAEEQAEAKKAAEKAEKRKQSSAEVQGLFDAGLKLASENKHEEAIAEFKKALEKDPEQANIWGNMADSYSKMGKDAEALETFQKAISVNASDAALYTNMGVVLSKMGKTAESQEAFKKAASLNPGAAAQNFYNLGATMVNNGKTAEAAEAFRQAIAADPNFAEAYYQLGMCLSGKPDTMADAIKALETYKKVGKKPDQIEIADQIIKALQQSMKK